MKISENRIKQIIRETIEKLTLEQDLINFGDSAPSNPYANVDNGEVTPFTDAEKKQNFSGIGKMGNPSYDAFKAWREEGLRRGIPSIHLSWNEYMKQKR